MTLLYEQLAEVPCEVSIGICPLLGRAILCRLTVGVARSIFSCTLSSCGRLPVGFLLDLVALQLPLAILFIYFIETSLLISGIGECGLEWVSRRPPVWTEAVSECTAGGCLGVRSHLGRTSALWTWRRVIEAA